MAVVSVWHRGHCGNVYLHLWLRIYDFAVMATCKLVTIFSVFFCGVTLLSKSNVEDSLTGANVEHFVSLLYGYLKTDLDTSHDVIMRFCVQLCMCADDSLNFELSFVISVVKQGRTQDCKKRVAGTSPASHTLCRERGRVWSRYNHRVVATAETCCDQ